MWYKDNIMKCKIICNYLNPHLQQIYTGYILLRQRGLIDLSIITPGFKLYDRVTRRIPRANNPQHLDVFINDCIHIHYDTQDGYAFDLDALNTCNFYFKRSYYPPYIESLSINKEKIFPLGLNYNVYPDSIDWSFINGIRSRSKRYRNRNRNKW